MRQVLNRIIGIAKSKFNNQSISFSEINVKYIKLEYIIDEFIDIKEIKVAY